ncbi:hypothetical protein [Bacillus sp. Marseille-P3661]|uniref:hypothetical protein n=1 Tax=Bacillus sp. Marseille-P3661 TaxID=1936234 RepID=UPI000C864567|nr:hypothetical protein [Bacillus sp. Marseille-P3661]
MEKVDSTSIVSIFNAEPSAPEMLQAMKDISSLSGVLSDLGSHTFYQSPIEILRFLRIIQLINEEALGLDEKIENAETLYYRYRNRYSDPEAPSKKKVEQIVNILAKYNWISKHTRLIKMRDVGKRMMDVLIRLANDSLAYHMHDDIGRSLFQARRDAEISEAYDDNGISGGNKIASMIKNVDDAIQLMKERELEMLADRNALPQLELIHELMKDLDAKLQERFRQFQTMEESLVLTDLMQRGTAVLAEGTNLSLGMINKYLKFTTMQKTPLSSKIQPEKVREYIVKMFDPPLESDVPNVYQLLSFMEQNQYEDEAVDGIWIPVKFAAPISATAIDEAITYIEEYEPITDKIVEEDEVPIFETNEISQDDLDELMRESNWLLTKNMIETTKIEEFLEHREQTPLEELVILATSSEWSDAVNALTAISALVGNKKVTIEKSTEKKELPVYERSWEWMNDDDRANIVRKRKGRKK